MREVFSVKLITRTELFRWLAAAGWMAFIWWLSSQPDLHSGLDHDWLLRKAAHVSVFAVLTILYWSAITRPRLRLVIAVLAAVLYAVFDEWHQSWVVGREGSLTDVGIDTIGIGVAATMIWLTNNKKLRRRF